MLNEKKKILLADDEQTILEIFKTFLGEKWKLTTAPGGKSALSKIESEIFHAIILDIGMPDLDGLEVCRLAMKSNPGIEKRVILITGYISDECLRFSKQHNVYCLQKPVILSELECILNKIH